MRTVVISLICLFFLACSSSSQKGDFCDVERPCDNGLGCLSHKCVPITWYDGATKLTWQQPIQDNIMDWEEAEVYCHDLGDSWRLPTITELRSLIRGCPTTQRNGTCNVTTQCSRSDCWTRCYSCPQKQGPRSDGCYLNLRGICSWYWSGTSMDGGDGIAWYINFDSGLVGIHSKNIAHAVRCVR